MHIRRNAVVMLALFGAAVSIAGACRRDLDRQRFARLEGASQALQASVNGKGTLDRYRNTLDSFVAELAGVKATTSREEGVLAKYTAALPRLEDLRAVWEAKMASPDSDRLPLSSPLAARIQREYDLPVNTNDPPSIYASEALQAIWTASTETLKAANATLTGR